MCLVVLSFRDVVVDRMHVIGVITNAHILCLFSSAWSHVLQGVANPDQIHSIMALTAGPGFDILRHRSQLVLPAVLVQQVLAIAITHLRHVGRL